MLNIKLTVPKYYIDENEIDILTDRVAKKTLSSILERVHDRSEGGDDETLSPNQPSWRENKLQNGFSTNPLVMTGELTEEYSWSVDYADDGVEITMLESQEYKWNTIQDVARELNKPDWIDAFYVSPSTFLDINLEIEQYFNNNHIIKSKKITR